MVWPAHTATETAVTRLPETAAPQRMDAAANDPDGGYANSLIGQAAERIAPPTSPDVTPGHRMATLAAAPGAWLSDPASHRCPHCAWH